MNLLFNIFVYINNVYLLWIFYFYFLLWQLKFELKSTHPKLNF